MYLQNDAEMVGKALAELYFTLIGECIYSHRFKNMNDLRRKMNIINQIITIDNNKYIILH